MHVPTRWRASLWMLGAVLTFTASTLSVRELGTNLSVFQIGFLRSIVGLPMVVLIAYLMHGRAAPAQMSTKNLRLQIFRNIVHMGGHYAWIYGIATIPLALVFAVEFSTPLWTAVLGALILREFPSRAQKIGLVIGLLGVLVIVRPSASGISPGVAAVLLSAFLYAGTYLCMRVLGRTDSALSMIFWMCAVQAPLGLPLALMYWHPIGLADVPNIVALSVGSLVALLCMSEALRLAPMAQVLPLDYLRLPLIAIIGAALYNEVVDPMVFVGGAVIIMGVVLTQNAKAPAEAPTPAAIVAAPPRRRFWRR